MCCFSDDVDNVSSTKIFARAGEDGKQFLVYQMHYEAQRDLAMILPIPTPPASPEDAVRFIDLSDYEEFFEDMEACFPKTRSAMDEGSKSLELLEVHEVGSFVASFVPTPQDFARVDPRFRLPEQAWEKLPQYSDYGFAVFKLKADAQSVHPMAFEFPRRNATELFFPTVHIHHGEVEPRAEFDHVLYCQVAAEQPRWHARADNPTSKMNIAKSQGIVDPEQPIWKERIHGLAPNEDIFLHLVTPR